MSIIPSEPWFGKLVALAIEMHGDARDRIGRPWCQHFERVALRTLFRDPFADRASVEAGLMHDALMAGGKGKDWLREIGCQERAIDIIDLITPPPHGDYFRALEAITPEDNAIYLNYVRGLVASGDERAMHVKLADINDTCDMLREATLPSLKAQLHQRYIPSRDLLQERLERTSTV